jgi:hypothetical protein
MLTPLKRTRFRELRRREDEGALSPEEQEELSLLIQEIEEAEAVYLGPATERLRRESEAIERQNKALRAFLSRAEALATQLESVVTRLETERQALDDERARLASQSAATESTAKS